MNEEDAVKPKVKDPCTALRILLGSTCTYTAGRIQDTRCRFAYAMAFSRCYSICSELRSGNDIYLMRQELIHLRTEAPKHFKKRWFNRENEYTMLAIEHAIEVVESILLRFVRGYSNEDETFIRNILEGDADGHQVCSYLERIGQIEG